LWILYILVYSLWCECHQHFRPDPRDLLQYRRTKPYFTLEKYHQIRDTPSASMLECQKAGGNGYS
jgi:hypothetical protein